MLEYTLVREQFLPVPLRAVFAFFADPANLEAITPDWLHFHIVTPLPIYMEAGAIIRYSLRWHGVPLSWKTEIREWRPPYEFVDEQLQGPYRLWHHTHTFRSVNEGTAVTDVVRYALPLGPLGWLAHSLIVRANLNAIFDYRAEQVARRLTAVSASL